MGRLLAWALVLGAAVLAGCTGAVERPHPEGAVLHLGNGGEPKSLDPQIVTGIIEERILSALFEGLVNFDPETLAPAPGVAKSWDISDDGKVYTFQLNPAARWSNGDGVTAADFVYSWKRILSPGLAGEYAYMLYPILNAEEYRTGELDDFDQVGVTALDEHTLEVTLRAPTPYFLMLQIHFAFYPVHQATVEAHGTMTQRDTPWVRPGNFVGNGPFQLVDWVPNDRIETERNPHYWDADSVGLDGIVFHPIADPNVEERSFRAGELHMTYTVPLNKIVSYQEANNPALRIDPYIGTEFIRFNVTRPPFDDVRVRKAFAMSIDRQTLVERVLRGGQIPAEHFTPPDTAGYTCDTRVPYDLEAARGLLAEAGFPNGEGFPAVEMIYNTGQNERLYSETLQAMWKDALGVDVQLANLDAKTWLANMIGLDYQMARSYWIGDYVHPSNFLEMFYTESGNNRTGFSEPNYEHLIRAAAFEQDTDKRNDLFQRAEKILLDSGVIAPVYFYTRPYLLAPNITGVAPNILGRITYRDIVIAHPPN